MNTEHLSRWQRLVSACRCSLAGLSWALKQERAFQEEVLVLLLVAIPGAVFLGQNAADRVLMIGSWLIVLVAELLNSSVEATIDRIGPEHHELSGRAKDLGSAAVFVAMLLSGLVWGLILWERWV